MKSHGLVVSLLLIALLSSSAGVADGAKKIVSFKDAAKIKSWDAWDDNGATPTVTKFVERRCVTREKLLKMNPGLKFWGQLETRKAKAIASEYWSVGCETLDRDYADWDQYKFLLADLGVKGETLLELPPLPEKPVEEWVWEGLVSRKDLYASDQLIELRKARVIEALAGFLPNVVLGGGGASLSIENLAVRGWAGSLMGTWAAFEGFRTVQQYRAARAEREAEFKLHEDRMLAVVVAVANAYRNLLFAREQAVAAQAYADAARLDHEASDRRYTDGQETLSTVLDKLAVRDEAEVKAIQAAYGEALAAVQLRQAVGWDLIKVRSKSEE